MKEFKVTHIKIVLKVIHHRDQYSPSLNVIVYNILFTWGKLKLGILFFKNDFQSTVQNGIVQDFITSRTLIFTKYKWYYLSELQNNSNFIVVVHPPLIC